MGEFLPCHFVCLAPLEMCRECYGDAEMTTLHLHQADLDRWSALQALLVQKEADRCCKDDNTRELEASCTNSSCGRTVYSSRAFRSAAGRNRRRAKRRAPA